MFIRTYFIPQGKHTVLNVKRLMPINVAVYSENHIKLISTLCRKNVDFLSAKQ
jgi:hypothetical protein